MKKTLLYIVLTVVFIVGLCIWYYYYPRKVPFELAKEIEKPCPEFDNSQFMGFEYARSKEEFMYWLTKHYSSFYLNNQIYDSIFAEKIANEFDFTRYDYLITYQKKLKDLHHSPYLTKSADDLYFDKRTPLIPEWDSSQANNVYIYRIKKNNQLRAPGP
jgi:hypothetical protein